MNKEVLRIVKKEHKDVLGNIIIDLCQMNEENEDRVLQLYSKYR